MNIFLSYSQEDVELAAAIVAVLTANNPSLSCFDADSMRTSGHWQTELGPALADSDFVLLFWCHHSSTSYEVRKEFALALERGKDVVPLLLDDTPVPGRLAGRRCIDFRDRVRVLHETAAGCHEADAPSGQVDADRRIARGISRQYEELLVMHLVREIERELAARLQPR